MKKLFLISGFFLLISDFLFAQNQNVGIGTTSPDSKAQLDVSSTNKGILIPRLTTTQRNNIATPPAGLMIYNTTTNNYNVYDGTSWKGMQKELPAGVQVLADTGQNAALSALGFSPIGNMYMSYRPASVSVTIPDSTWYSINSNDPDSLQNPSWSQFLGGSLYWTGSEALYLRVDSNFRYNPSADLWISNANSYNIPEFYLPYIPSSVWTGSEVICWFGNSGYKDKIYRFNPQTNIFSVLNSIFPYSSRINYSLTWANGKLITWGGSGGGFSFLNDGAIYDLATNVWTAISMPVVLQSTVPGRYGHTAVWTGTDVIIWGGRFEHSSTCASTYTNSGFRLNPVNITYTALPTINAPQGRVSHSAIWTGSEMIIFGGKYTNCLNSTLPSSSHGRYNLATNTWASFSGPEIYDHETLWTGNHMIIIGRDISWQTNYCFAFNPVNSTWTTLQNRPVKPVQSIWATDKIITLAPVPNLNRYLPGYAYSMVPKTIMEAPPRRETKLAVWRKN